MWCVSYGEMQGLGCDPPWKAREFPYNPIKSSLGMADMEELPQSRLLLPDVQDVQDETPDAMCWLLQRPRVARHDGSGTDNVGQENGESKHKTELVGRPQIGVGRSLSPCSLSTYLHRSLAL